MEPNALCGLRPGECEGGCDEPDDEGPAMPMPCGGGGGIGCARPKNGGGGPAIIRPPGPPGGIGPPRPIDGGMPGMALAPKWTGGGCACDGCSIGPLPRPSGLTGISGGLDGPPNCMPIGGGPMGGIGGCDESGRRDGFEGERRPLGTVLDRGGERVCCCEGPARDEAAAALARSAASR